MDENTLKKVVEEVINKAVDPIRKQLEDSDTGLAAINRRLDDPKTGLVAINNRLESAEGKISGVIDRLDDSETGLAAINSRLDANTGAIINLEKTVKGYADSYKVNDSNIRKVVKRVETLEDEAGVNVPEELQLASMSDI